MWEREGGGRVKAESVSGLPGFCHCVSPTVKGFVRGGLPGCWPLSPSLSPLASNTSYRPPGVPNEFATFLDLVGAGAGPGRELGGTSEEGGLVDGTLEGSGEPLRMGALMEGW